MQRYFSHFSEIKNANLSRKFLVSYDVTSLFTNIPLQKTTDIAINLIFNHNPNLYKKCFQIQWLNECNLNIPNFFLRYVDDILAAFDNKQDSLNFLEFLDNRQLNIKFTIEKQINHSIAFLMYSFQISIIKVSHFKHLTNRPIQDFC